MSSSYSVSISSRLLLLVLGLVIVIGSVIYSLPATSLRYIGIYYAVVGVFNLFILPLFCALRHSRFELSTLEVGDLAGASYTTS